MHVTLPERASVDLNAADLHRRVNALRTIDNTTNWIYLLREYLYLALVIGLPIIFFHGYESWGLHWAWNIPVVLVAIGFIGAGQHRLTTLAHEASHYMLFRNRLLNEVISDWFCMFPMWSTTHHYRLQHLAHHQFVNDPERDPDIAQMTASGHRFHFPMARLKFVWECVVKQVLWLPGLIRYIRVRAKYSSTGSGTGPYESKAPASRMLILVGMLYLLAQIGLIGTLVWVGNPWLLGTLPVALWVGIIAFYARAPESMYRKSLVRPDVSGRWTTYGRVTFLTGVFLTLGWLTLLTGRPWWLYYIVLWLVPMATSFSFFMILRQVVQHGNAGRDRLTNTRIFHVSPLIRFAVFPLGMDYHLPHHMFPMVPHFRLKQLHDLLNQSEPYRKNATVVDGYFFHGHVPPENPTVLDLMSEEPRVPY